MAEEMVRANGVELCVETFGDRAAPAILLISGGASSMDYWDPEFCHRLADGRFVIRYDHRDTGRSVSYPPGEPGYPSSALVLDALALIDVLANGRAHVVGLSMGGGIAQQLAIEHPSHVATLTLMSTSSGPADDLPPMADELKAAFANPVPEPDWTDHVAVVDYFVEVERPYAASFDEARARALVEKVVSRTVNPESAAKNHWATAGGDGDSLRPRLAEVTAPTLVIHGSADPMFPPGHGEALAREIPGAEFLLLDGVGHEWPPPRTWDTVVSAILRLTS